MVGRIESVERRGQQDSSDPDWGDIYRGLIPGPPTRDAARSAKLALSPELASHRDETRAAGTRDGQQIVLASSQRTGDVPERTTANHDHPATFNELIHTSQALPAKYRDRPMRPADDEAASRSNELGFRRLFPDGDRNTMCWIDVSATNGRVLERHWIDSENGVTTTVHETFAGEKGEERCNERRQTRTQTDGTSAATTTVFDLSKPGEVAAASQESIGHFITSKTWYASDGTTPNRIEEYLKNQKDGNEENDAISHPKDERHYRPHTEYLEVPGIPGDPMKVHERDSKTGAMRTSEYSIGNAALLDIPGDPAKVVPAERQKSIDQAVRLMEDAFANNKQGPAHYEGAGHYRTNTLSDGKVDFAEYGKILLQIANRKDWTEPEKLYAWTRLNGDEGSRYSISTEHTNPKTLDSFRGGWDPYHAFLKAGARDGYHGPMFSMDQEDANRVIEQHEKEEMTSGGWLRNSLRWGAGLMLGGKDGINEGDVQASQAQAAALRQMRMDGFIGYATEWNKRFVDASMK